MSGQDDKQITYADAGVDIEAGDRAVALMRQAVSATHNDDVLAGEGEFAGAVDASALLAMRRPLLVTSTDGVGTKLELARQLDIHDTIGQDLVAMVVDDIAVSGAKPLFMTDYIACGKLDPVRIAGVVGGIAQACRQVDTPLIGGETAEHPGVMPADHYDLAGAATGVVDADQLLGAKRVRAGDVLVALAASGLHSNGYSLVRRIIAQAGADLHAHVDDLGCALGQELLRPTRLYSRLCLQLAQRLGVGEDGVHALSHITGGGLGANVSRVLPRGLAATIDRASWLVPPVFGWLARTGNVPADDLEQTLNMGVGMVAIVAQQVVDEAVELARRAGVQAWQLGRVDRDPGQGGCPAGVRRVAGAKGADGGAALLAGSYRWG